MTRYLYRAAIGALILASASATAGAQDMTYDNRFHGPYAGGDLGYSWGNYDVNNPAGPDGDADVNGWNAGLFAGYGFARGEKPLAGYIGTEIGYEWNGADGSLGPVGFEKNGNLYAAVKPGAIIQYDMLAYGIIGLSRTNFEASNGDDETLTGMMIGAGAEFTSEKSPVNFRAEYIYTNYGEANFNGVDFDGHDSTIKAGALFRF